MNYKSLVSDVAWTSASVAVVDMLGMEVNDTNILMRYGKIGGMLTAVDELTNWIRYKNGRIISNNGVDIYVALDDTFFNSSAYYALDKLNVVSKVNELVGDLPFDDRINTAITGGVVKVSLLEIRKMLQQNRSFMNGPLSYLTNVSKIWGY
jgi:hypothetical protein